jgi:hypothetical protein
VYQKLPFQIMQGTNPDGSQYADPVKWVSYFDGGQAVHYFSRGSYGWPQSLGCVELPYGTAEQAYGYLPYGTLVTVAPLPVVRIADFLTITRHREQLHCYRSVAPSRVCSSQRTSSVWSAPAGSQ